MGLIHSRASKQLAKAQTAKIKAETAAVRQQSAEQAGTALAAPTVAGAISIAVRNRRARKSQA